MTQQKTLTLEEEIMSNLMKVLDVVPYQPELYLKSKLSSFYLMDASDFHYRSKLLLEDPINYSNSYVGKILVDMILCIECSLKSLIISLSTEQEKPENAYNAARKCVHKIENLINEVKNRIKTSKIKFLNAGEIKMLVKVDSISVHARYSFESYQRILEEDPIEVIFKSGKVSEVININYLDNLFPHITKLYRIAHESYNLNCKKYNFFNLKDSSDIKTRLEKFCSTIDRKKGKRNKAKK